MTSDVRANVLLVDDKPENLLAMEAILADLDQNLISATSAREALKYLLIEDVALILLDVQMPGLNGFELAELIRERERTQDTPIIFVSAENTQDQYVFKGYSLGAVDYLTKPIEPEILKSKVRFFTRLYLQNQEIKRQAAMLEQANSRLDNLNAGLEKRVRTRTRELELINRELENEVSVRKVSEARLATEHAVTRALAEARDLDTAAPKILKAFCDHMDAAVASLWALNDLRTELYCYHLESRDGAEGLQTYIDETRSRKLSIGIGLPGSVWEADAPLTLPHSYQGDAYPRAKVAASAGLHSATGFPIRIGSELFGVIEFVGRSAVHVDRPLLNALEAIGSEIGQFIQKKRAEMDRENLLQREKSLREQAERANRLKDEFLATVSHELRTPLNSILGWGQILNAGGLSDDEEKTALETIYRNAKSQAQLIDDLLDTSRLITGNLMLDLSPTDAVATIEAAIDVVRPAAESKGLKLETKFTSDVTTITCDPQRLQQMVWNLLTNAVKFTPSGGTITASLEHEGDSIKIRISDTGQGISPDFLPFVFDRFRQADSSSTRVHEGLGLGLAIVRHLAELHGGHAHAESEGIGHGASFVLTLPASGATATTQPVAAPTSANGRHASDAATPQELQDVRIMIVDDDHDACNMLAFALGSMGADVRTCRSASEAIEEFEKDLPQVLLTDINMPGEDGYSLLKRIRNMRPEQGSDVPAIALTAMARPEDSDRTLSAGFQLHVAKPVEIQVLSEAIARLVAEGKASG